MDREDPSFSAGPTSLNGDRNTSFGNSFASFLLDQPSSTSRELRNIIPELDQTALFSYVQDKWQVGPKLTIDLGLRHEIYLPPTPHSRGGFSNYDPNTTTLLLVGLGNVPSTTVATDWTGFLRASAFPGASMTRRFRGGFGGSLIAAARILGADLAYLGTRFISMVESLAPREFKEMIVAASAKDIVYTPAISGVHANFLRPSIQAAGLDPDNLPPARKLDMGEEAKVWRDIWSAGQGVGDIRNIPPAGALCDHLRREYKLATDKMGGS